MHKQIKEERNSYLNYRKLPKIKRLIFVFHAYLKWTIFFLEFVKSTKSSRNTNLKHIRCSLLEINLSCLMREFHSDFMQSKLKSEVIVVPFKKSWNSIKRRKMAKDMIKIFVINCNHNQQIILKVDTSIKYTAKLFKLFLKFTF